MKLPKVITTSVVRSARQGESHGGVYLVDLGTKEIEQVIDWNDPSISWEGRGGDRGLRGIAFYKDHVYIAASDEVFIYDQRFKLLGSHRNKYLKHCHEISAAEGVLYLTATDANGILEFDLERSRFTRGYRILYRVAESGSYLRRATALLSGKQRLAALPFDPNDPAAPVPTGGANDLHINNVARHGNAITISGTQIEALLRLEAGVLREHAPLPIGTHNAAIYGDRLIYNDTRSDRVVVADAKGNLQQGFAVPRYHDLPATHVPNDHARQGFARGLCLFDNLIIAGSSPSTISVYDVGTGETLQVINISKDIRNCIHGLELWPYD